VTVFKFYRFSSRGNVLNGEGYCLGEGTVWGGIMSEGVMTRGICYTQVFSPAERFGCMWQVLSELWSVLT